MTFKSIAQCVALTLVLLVWADLPTVGVSVREVTPTTRIRIFSNRELRSIVLRCHRPLSINGVPAQASLRLTARDGAVSVATFPPTTEQRLTSKLWINAAGGEEIFVQTPGGARRRLVGLLEVSNRDGRLILVDALPVEMYVLGVMEPELGSLHVPVESLKAQLIASRSYVMAMHGRHAHDGFDFCDGPHCQTFRGIVHFRQALALASASVHGQYLSFRGRVIPAFYHDSCGGSTTDVTNAWGIPSLPYLRTVRDGDEPYCRFAPSAHWHRRLSRGLLQRGLARAGLLANGAPVNALDIAERDPSGRVLALSVASTKNIRVSIKRFESALHRQLGETVFPSTLFSIDSDARGYVVTGRGWGHGVGLCQWGAIEMAREGKSYREILDHYYPGTTLERSPRTLDLSTNLTV